MISDNRRTMQQPSIIKASTNNIRVPGSIMGPESLNAMSIPSQTSSVIIDPSQAPTGSNSNIFSSNPQTLEQNLEKLLALTPVEIKDEIEERMCRCYLFVQNQILGKSEHQIHEELSRMCRESNTYSEEIILGLIVSMLLDFHNSHRIFIPIILSGREGAIQLTSILNMIIIDKYHRLHEHPRRNLLLLCKELLRNQHPNNESIFYNLMRHIVSGDTTTRNLALAENILDMFIELRGSYDSNVPLVQYALFKYLRLIVDHINPVHQRLLMKEIKFCHCLLAERFSDFLPIGRDLVRLLQQICRVGDFNQLWKTILTNPGTLTPGFNIVQLMKTRTNKKFIRLLITHDMEKKLMFLVNSVRLGSQRRYQDWFQKQYLNMPENQMLRTDLIRFICNFIHPSNEIIASDLVPRWAVIGWILNSCPNPVTMAWSRMALFYDWLMFDFQDLNNNSIMDLEPGLLVMYFSLKNYTGITTALLDFLCRTSTEFYPPLSNQIKQGICNAFIHQLEKRVIASLSFMLDPTKIDPQLRQLFQRTFPELQNLMEPIPPPMPSGSMLPIGSASPYQQQTPSGVVVVPNGQQPQYFTSPQMTSATTVTTSCSAVVASCSSTSAIIVGGATGTSQMPSSTTISCFYSAASNSASPSYNTELLLNSNNSSGVGSIPVTAAASTSSQPSSSSAASAVRLLPSSVVVVSASHAQASMTPSLLTPNTNPILTNIKPLNVSIKQISSNSSSSTASTIIGTTTTLITGPDGFPSHQSNIAYPQPQSIIQQTPVMATTSKFSDDEDEIPDTRSDTAGKLKPPPIKKMKKSNSFSSGSSTKPKLSVIAKSSSNGSSAASIPTTIKPGVNSNPPPSQGSTNPEYIAKILNSTVIMNNSGSNSQQTAQLNNSVSVIRSPGQQVPKDLNAENMSGKPEIVTIIEDSTGSDGSDSVIANDLNYSTGTYSNSLDSAMLNFNDGFNSNCDRFNGPTLSQEEFNEHIEQIPIEEIRSLVRRLAEDRSLQAQSETMEQLINRLVKLQDPDDEDADLITNLTVILSAILDEGMSRKRYPHQCTRFFSNWLHPDHRQLKASIEGPLFVMFGALVDNYQQQRPSAMINDNNDDSGNSINNKNESSVLKTLLGELCNNNGRVGFLLIYYLTVNGYTFDRMVVYRDVVRFMNKDLTTTLINDLETCIGHDYHMFFYLVPTVIRAFPSILTGNLELLSLILAFADYNPIQYLATLIQRDQLRLFKKESLPSVITASVDFDDIQQHLVWELLDAHDFPVETYLSVLSKLDDNGAETTASVNHLMNMFKREEPTSQYLKLLMNRENHKLGDYFVVSVLMFWAKRYTVTLADIIGKYVSSIINSPNKRNKRALNVTKNQMNKTANVEQLLCYLDEMRKSLGNNKDNDFFNQEFLTVILCQVKQICNSQQKNKYAELFANVPDDDNNNSKNISGSSGNSNSKKSSGASTSGHSGSSGGNKKPNRKTIANNSSNNSATESDSSEEDVPHRMLKSNLRNKKRKQPTGFDSD